MQYDRMDERLILYIDGDLTGPERAEVEAALADSYERREQLTELRHMLRHCSQGLRCPGPPRSFEELRKSLNTTFEDILEDPQPAQLDTPPAISPALPQPAQHRRRRSPRRVLAAAAVLAFAVLAFWIAQKVYFFTQAPTPAMRTDHEPGFETPVQAQTAPGLFAPIFVRETAAWNY